MTISMDGRYQVAGYGGVAFYLNGWGKMWDADEQEWVEDPDHTHVIAVMVGDDREHIVDVDDLTLLDDDDYCSVCGQIGCTQDAR